MRRVIVTLFKILFSIAALVNLTALFLFDYQIPAQWKLSERLHMPFLARLETMQTEVVFYPDETERQGSGIRISVPAGAILYNGEGKLDLLYNVYVVNANGTSAGNIPVGTKISAGSGRREKTVTYTAVTPDGETLTAVRALSLGTRYTGPSIRVLGSLPWCEEGSSEDYARVLAGSGAILAEDGFENDITDQIITSLKRYDAGVEEATIKVSVTNIFGDSYETEIQVPMNDTGIVLRLTTAHVQIDYGSSFSALDYIEECYDREGNDLRDSVVIEGDVDSSVPGDYQVRISTADREGTRSIERQMTVTVPEPQEESGGE